MDESSAPHYVDAADRLSERAVDIILADLSVPLSHLGAWTQRDLGAHLGSVYEFVTTHVAGRRLEYTPSGPQAEPPVSADEDEFAHWLDERRRTMVDALAGIAADEAVWSWSSQARHHRGSFWHRRMAMENAVHLLDAAMGAETTVTLPPEFCVDAIDEYFDIGLRQSRSRPDRTYPTGSVHLHATDCAGEWLLRSSPEGVVVTAEHAKGDAAVRGGAQELLLFAWGRPCEVEILGDDSVARAWAALAP